MLQLNQYIQFEFSDVIGENAEMLIAQLDNIGFEGFEENDNGLIGFIKSGDYDKVSLQHIVDSMKISFKETVISDRNWNEVWESNFPPVVIQRKGNKNPWVSIRADFHEPVANAAHEIVITPKMSFGTGHHATTRMMILQMGTMNFINKNVMDFGSGTGILAILAEKLGASKVIAIDNDQWCIENCNENIERNHCVKTTCIKGEEPAVDGRFDIILANINKNVIIGELGSLANKLASTGVLVLSGILSDDESAVIASAGAFGLKKETLLEDNNWISIRLHR